MDILGLSKGEIDELFVKDRQVKQSDIRRRNAEAARIKADAKKQERLKKALNAEALALFKKQMEEADRVKKEEAVEKEKIMNLQICKKYTDGATLKSLRDEYIIKQCQLDRILKNNKIPKRSTQTN